MEISSDKTISSSQLPEYWRFLQHSLVNYIAEIHTIGNTNNITDLQNTPAIQIYPNPTNDKVFVKERTLDDIHIFNIQGKEVMLLPAGTQLIDFKGLSDGVYILRTGTYSIKIVKR